MNLKKDTIFTILKVISWIIFLGLCTETGALIFNYVLSLFKPVATHNLYMGLDLSGLYEKSKTDYAIVCLLVIIISSLKAYMFYLIVTIFLKLNIVKPFSNEVSTCISKIGYFVLAIGLVDYLAIQYATRLTEQHIDLGIAHNYWDDYGAFLLMAAIIFVISQIFKKGIELQKEIDLTI